MNKVLADKGYLGRENFRAIVKAGAEPYIPFKPNSKPSKADALWTRLSGSSARGLARSPSPR